MPDNDHLNKEALYVDENRNIHRGEEAIKRINARKIDYVDITKGVTCVDIERWNEAQRYERRTWMDGIAAMSDRNELHESCYGNYLSIHKKKFSKAIELGCGPFTNIRKILSYCFVEDITLLDPLANDYLKHPFCRYKNSKLGGILKTSIIPWSKRGGFKHPFRFIKHKINEWKIGKFRGRPITIVCSGIESFKPTTKYDLCIMINVIEHCMNIDQIFERILEMTKPGSYFIFADKVYDAKEEAELAIVKFDAGHPIRVDYSVIDSFLKHNFNAIWNNYVMLEGDDGSYTCSYFIGIRK